MLVRLFRGIIRLPLSQNTIRMLGSTHKPQQHTHKSGEHEQHKDEGHDHHHEINRDKIILRNPRSGYYLDPKEVATRIVKIIGIYDTIQDVSNVKLTTQWHELGLDEIDMVNISVAVENDFDIEFPDEQVEKFKDIEDMVKYVAKSFHAA